MRRSGRTVGAGPPARRSSPVSRRSRGRQPGRRERSASRTAALPTIQRSTRRSRFGLVVPRVGSPSARARPAASRGCLAISSGARPTRPWCARTPWSAASRSGRRRPPRPSRRQRDAHRHLAAHLHQRPAGRRRRTTASRPGCDPGHPGCRACTRPSRPPSPLRSHSSVRSITRSPLRNAAPPRAARWPAPPAAAAGSLSPR